MELQFQHQSFQRMIIQDRFPLGLTGLISLQSKRLSGVFFNTTIQKHQFFNAQPSLSPTLTSVHDCWEAIALTILTFVSKVMSLLFNTLSRFVIDFPPRSKCLLNFMSSVTIHSDFGAQENSVCHCFHFFRICHEVMGPDALIFVF